MKKRNVQRDIESRERISQLKVVDIPVVKTEPTPVQPLPEPKVTEDAQSKESPECTDDKICSEAKSKKAKEGRKTKGNAEKI